MNVGEIQMTPGGYAFATWMTSFGFHHVYLAAAAALEIFPAMEIRKSWRNLNSTLIWVSSCTYILRWYMISGIWDKPCITWIFAIIYLIEIIQWLNVYHCEHIYIYMPYYIYTILLYVYHHVQSYSIINPYQTKLKGSLSNTYDASCLSRPRVIQLLEHLSTPAEAWPEDPEILWCQDGKSHLEMAPMANSGY